MNYVPSPGPIFKGVATLGFFGLPVFLRFPSVSPLSLWLDVTPSLRAAH